MITTARLVIKPAEKNTCSTASTSKTVHNVPLHRSVSVASIRLSTSVIMCAYPRNLESQPAADKRLARVLYIGCIKLKF